MDECQFAAHNSAFGTNCLGHEIFDLLDFTLNLCNRIFVLGILFLMEWKYQPQNFSDKRRHHHHAPQLPIKLVVHVVGI